MIGPEEIIRKTLLDRWLAQKTKEAAINCILIGFRRHCPSTLPAQVMNHSRLQVLLHSPTPPEWFKDAVSNSRSALTNGVPFDTVVASLWREITTGYSPEDMEIVEEQQAKREKGNPSHAST